MGKKGKLDPATIAMVIIVILLAIWFIIKKGWLKLKIKKILKKILYVIFLLFLIYLIFALIQKILGGRMYEQY